MQTAVTLDSVVRVSDSQVSALLGDEVVILELNTGQYYGLEGIGPAVWKLVQSPVAVRDVRDEILRLYDVEAEVCERDLLALLADMAERRILDVIVPRATPG
jgi:hypothetical protein